MALKDASLPASTFVGAGDVATTGDRPCVKARLKRPPAAIAVTVLPFNEDGRSVCPAELSPRR